ncbi:MULTISPECIES: HPr family phosphocarrier protein [Sediminibacillus]|uniref:Catabolite repression HPr-like protein n=2 Tax=Sediminibacillus TaxID=482460 RepID=A0A1G9R7P3_9BACI|nr:MULTISPECIES: HPr family phosphocarrier protein [Sediminibacillus]QTN00336.1 HPr family phosphocarrier protein [Sediminibacillus dalangtanensis]SDM19150.1 catabolite repression HPr-like protein [Sediminibacillus halophilus]
MKQKEMVVELEAGLQARPAAQFVQKASGFSAALFIEKDGKRVNAKSIMGLMSLAIATGEEITLIAEGSDETTAIDQLSAFINPGQAEPTV